MRILFLHFAFLASVSLFSQNYSLQIDGATERIQVPHKADFNAKDGFTMEAWIYADSWKNLSWQGSLITKDTQGPDRGFAFRCGDNGKLSFVAAVDNSWNEVLTSSVMNTEQWHHVAVVVANGTMSLFVDGSKMSSAPYDGDFSDNELPLTIGASAGFGDRHFNGRIDEVRIWNKARTEAEIADNISTAFSGNEAGLVAYFPMDAGSGNIAINSVDSDCNGALLNMDDSNWKDGYTIPDYDIALLPIASIDLINMNARPVKVSIDIKNNGLLEIGDISAIVTVDGNEVINEPVNGVIQSGDVLSYVLRTPIDLTEAVDPEITVTLSQSQDQNTFNNSKTLMMPSMKDGRIAIYDQVQHNFGAAGQNQFRTVLMPGDLSEYQQIILHLDLDCPGSGCDPWDQPAKISISNAESTFEIVRYVTPYGIACGPWQMDITDFKDELTGAVTFDSYVQVWGQSGWLVTIELEFIEGQADNPYTKMTPLWTTDYHVYGDPGIEDDLNPQSLTIANNTQVSTIRMTNTGHGQGNTENAAEFSNKTHVFTLDEQAFFDHNLWRADCADNVCENQAGTWLFSRAGWCPGDIVQPAWVNTSDLLTPGMTASLDYELEEYTNLLNTGYNDSGHTEPHYRIWSYLVEQSNTRYNEYRNLEAISINPTISGDGENEVLEALSMTIKNTGSVQEALYSLEYQINTERIQVMAVSEILEPGEEVTLDFTLLDGYVPGATNIFYGIIEFNDDQNIGDDVTKFVKEGTTSTKDQLTNITLNVYPNPSNGNEIYLEHPEWSSSDKLVITDLQGRVVLEDKLSGEITAFSIDKPGVYFAQIYGDGGSSRTAKIIIY